MGDNWKIRSDLNATLECGGLSTQVIIASFFSIVNECNVRSKTVKLNVCGRKQMLKHANREHQNRHTGWEE